MRRSRRARAAALLLAGSMALAACASGEAHGGADNGGDGLRVGLAYDAAGGADRSFDDSAHAGAMAAVQELGGEVEVLSPSEDAADRARLLTQLAEQGLDPVIAVGLRYDDAIAEVAPRFPGTTFAQVDGSNEDGSKGENVTGLVFAEEEGSFLAGVAAALKSETGRIGFLGGVDSPVIQKCEAGYVAGARAANPGIVIDRQYISPDVPPGGSGSGFDDPARGQALAQGMYDAGADIVYHVAGGSGLGVFRAAAASGDRAIGVNADQYQTVDDPALQAVIMTSMVTRVDVAVQDFIHDYTEGNVEGATDIRYDLASDGVGLATSGGFIADIQDELDRYRRQIIEGTIEVPIAV